MLEQLAREGDESLRGLVSHGRGLRRLFIIYYWPQSRLKPSIAISVEQWDDFETFRLVRQHSGKLIPKNKDRRSGSIQERKTSNRSKLARSANADSLPLPDMAIASAPSEKMANFS
ncbi:hypothetical protein WOC76_03660 [Methylocystis sp. IM3]|uniref:hypothetical protein n=1 Tax=unclassified Methylocystis TaxID=2625913 RepID=UPI0030FBB84F